VNLDPILSPWRDYHLRMTGEGVQDALTEFQIDWKREFDETELLSESRFNPVQGQTVKHQIVPSEPVNMEGFMLDLFERAETSIFIGSPYFIPTTTLFASLKKKLKENIRVTILVPGIPDHALVQPASYRYLRELIALGAMVYQFQNGFYHAKAVLIDEKLCDIGTTNFDRRSLLINDEINVITTDPATIEQLITSIQGDLQRSVLLTKEKLKPSGIIDFAKECFARTIAHLL